MDWAGIQQKYDYGRGKEAGVLGPPYQVYRPVNPDSGGNVLIAGNLIQSNWPVYTKIAYGAEVRTDFEAERQQGVLWYNIIADMSPFKVGDIFILNDPVYGQGSSSVNFSTSEFKGFALADHSPVKKALGGRLNTTVTIERPSTAPNSSGQWDKTLNNAQPVVLASSVYGLASVGATATKIPAGLVASGRSYGDRDITNLPAETRKSSWMVYLPALNGFNPREGDRIIAADGASYILIVPFTQRVGATGSQFFCERERA